MRNIVLPCGQGMRYYNWYIYPCHMRSIVSPCGQGMRYYNWYISPCYMRNIVLPCGQGMRYYNWYILPYSLILWGDDCIHLSVVLWCGQVLIKAISTLANFRVSHEQKPKKRNWYRFYNYSTVSTPFINNMVLTFSKRSFTEIYFGWFDANEIRISTFLGPSTKRKPITLPLVSTRAWLR